VRGNTDESVKLVSLHYTVAL